MMPAPRIGSLVKCVIVREAATQDLYLAVIAGTEMLACLPRRFADREYNAGEETTAAVFMMGQGRIYLSQKSPQYFRRITEEVLFPVIREGKVRVRKAASVANSSFAKVSIEGLKGVDPLSASLPYLERIKDYTATTITIVRYSANIKEYIVNALVPAPSDKVSQVLYSQSLREAVVRVDPRYCGYFVGKGGSNVATAAKLLNVKIVIKGASPEWVESEAPDECAAVQKCS